MTNTTLDLDEIRKDPSRHFEAPHDVLEHSQFSQTQKLEILEQWELDARELETAASENMAGGEPSCLLEVREAIHQLMNAKPETQEDTEAPVT